FYDQSANRRRLGSYLPAGARVLDVCSYVGAWAVSALRQGAAAAHCVDASQAALDCAQANAARNGVAVEVTRADAFDALKALGERDARFDVVVLDPPAFIKRKKDIPQGQAAYRKLNQLALGVLAKRGCWCRAPAPTTWPPRRCRRRCRAPRAMPGASCRSSRPAVSPPITPCTPPFPRRVISRRSSAAPHAGSAKLRVACSAILISARLRSRSARSRCTRTASRPCWVSPAPGGWRAAGPPRPARPGRRTTLTT